VDRWHPRPAGSGRCGSVSQRTEQGSRAVHVGRVEGRGPAQERRELGRPESNSVDFDVKRISKLNMI
jgi:hypothetical protein